MKSYSEKLIYSLLYHQPTSKKKVSSPTFGLVQEHLTFWFAKLQ